MKKSYSIPVESFEHSYTIKKSQFIARLAYAENREQTMLLLAQAKVDFPDARHHCWAYLLGDPERPRSVACSDDGEPSGTAGKPILNVLNHRGVGDIMVVVIRYFGGIKLGASGLVRAYSTATQLAIEKLETATLRPTSTIRLNCDFDQESSLRRFLAAIEAQILDCEYVAGIEMRVAVADEDLERLSLYCAARKSMSLQPCDNP